MVFLSGQLPLDPAGIVAGATAAEQAKTVLDNMRSVLAAAGLSMDDVVKTTIFLADMADFAAVNAVYGEYFSEPYPARSTIQVGALPKGAQVEIEAIALRQP
jgi:2-iminobutanoate/2-iminopropanoate deaminase